ncbi:MAG TPA: hypothetical protein VGA09_17850, partial [Candidatus Binatia bacterium]
ESAGKSREKSLTGRKKAEGFTTIRVFQARDPRTIHFLWLVFTAGIGKAAPSLYQDSIWNKSCCFIFRLKPLVLCFINS